MIVIYGVASYGRVEGRDGQSRVTQFAHVYYLPLFPVASRWITRRDADGAHGHAARWSGRSIAAGYARVWGPVVAVASAMTGGTDGLVAAGLCAVATGLSWAWRSVRDPREQRRSDFHHAALGTRCDPLAMPTALAEAIQPIVANVWASVSEGSTPEDVARFGASTPAQAVYAYASLRLAARLGPPESRRAAREASERVLDAARDVDPRQLEGGPYRASLPAPAP